MLCKFLVRQAEKHHAWLIADSGFVLHAKRNVRHHSGLDEHSRFLCIRDHCLDIRGSQLQRKRDSLQIFLYRNLHFVSGCGAVEDVVGSLPSVV